MCGTLVCPFQDAVILSCFIHNKKKNPVMCEQKLIHISFFQLFVYLCVWLVLKNLFLFQKQYMF